MSDKIYFTTTDPEGRTIRLSASTWRHIKEKHPEIRGVAEVKSVVKKPDAITKISSRTSMAYTKISRSDLLVNVYTKMDDTYTEGSVSTAFLDSKMPKGNVVWSQKKK